MPDLFFWFSLPVCTIFCCSVEYSQAHSTRTASMASSISCNVVMLGIMRKGVVDTCETVERSGHNVLDYSI